MFALGFFGEMKFDTSRAQAGHIHLQQRSSSPHLARLGLSLVIPTYSPAPSMILAFPYRGTHKKTQNKTQEKRTN